jgi:hypothetical protein
MQIDRDNGTVTFPNGLKIDPALTQNAFRALPAGSGANRQDYGTRPWIHYLLAGGQVDGKELLVRLCFHDQLLVFVSVSADLYPPGPKDWSNYSLEVEAATKQFHDCLLEQMLGRPSSGAIFLFGHLGDVKETLERSLRWDFSWGSVISSHDFKGGGTEITVEYGARLEEANKAYRRRSTMG